MNLLILLALLIFSSNTRGGSSPDYLPFAGEDLQEEFFEDEDKDANFTSDYEELNHSKQDWQSIGFTTVESPETSFPHFEDAQEDYEEGRSGEEEGDGPANFNLSNERLPAVSPTFREVVPKKQLLDHFLKMYQNGYSNFGDHFQSDETRPNQNPMRRQINNWRASDEFFDPNNIPWNLDTYYSRVGSPNVQNEYADDASFSMDSLQRNTSFVGLPEENKDRGYQVEYPQYYQKNYYYNYYPLVNGRKYAAPKWSGEEIFDLDESNKREKPNGRKPLRKNPCKQYLQFLKYAFKELDENTEYHYDYNEEYNGDWEEKEPQKNHRVFATQLLGPTLYIDNSGKVSQINTKGNGVQMVEGISSSSKVVGFTKDISKPKLTTPAILNRDGGTVTDMPTTLLNLNLNNLSSTTPDYSLLRITGSTRSALANETESQTLNSILKQSNLGTKLIKQWSQTVREDRYSTTVATDLKEGTTFEEYVNSDTASTVFQATTSPSVRFSPEDYYRKLGNAMERAMPSEETNASVGSSLYWYIRSSTPAPTAIASVSPVNNVNTKTVLSFKNSNELGRKEEIDCNDKMLPCPDTFNITYPLNGYCNRYVSCESGRAIRRTCPEGLHFNIITKSCDFPHNSFCTYSCPKPDGYYGIPGDCGGYFICKNFIPEYRMCPPKMHWDIKRSTCTFAEFSSCPMKCFKTNEVRHYEGDCKAYLICLNGIPYYHKCPPNTKFDGKAQACVPDHQSKCEDDSRLLTKTLNPNSLCREVEMKLGSKIWCSYIMSENQKS